MVDRVFDTVDDAVAAARRAILFYVRVDGVYVNATEAHIVHDVRSIGQATVYLPKPAPASLALNATLEIEIGHPGTVRRRFFGFIPKWTYVFTSSGYVLRVSGVGWLSYLNYGDPDGTSLPEISLKDAFYSLGLARDIPALVADDTYYPSGDVIMLGGNPDVDGGGVSFDSDTSPGSYLQQNAELYGYRVHDAPDGAPRLSRVSGTPSPQRDELGETYDVTPGTWVRGRTSMNVREGPGTSYAVVGDLDIDLLAYIIDGPIINNSGSTNNHWYRGRILNGATGWFGSKNAGGEPLLVEYDVLEPVYFYDEGVNVREFEYDYDRTPIVTYAEVIGRNYTAADGGPNEIRSIPAEVDENPYIEPQTYIRERYQSRWIVTDQQAEGARNVKEIDLSAPYTEVRWKAGGREDIQPGEIVVITSATWGLSNQPFWITQIADDLTDSGGYEQRFTAWAGAGEALPAGDDCASVTVTNSIIHAGNQTISWYADPSPDGEDVTVNFTNVFEDYSSLRVGGLAHGTNTYNEKTVSEGSKIEIWQLPDPSAAAGPDNELRRMGSVDLPTLHEETRKRRNYGASNTYWTPFLLPIRGQLKLGAAVMHFIAGENPDGFDDYEVKNVYIKACGVGEPITPGDA